MVEECCILLSDKKLFFRPHSTEGILSQVVQRSGHTKTLTFQLSWLNEYEWLVYSPSQKGAFCKSCVLFPTRPKGVHGTHALVNSAFTKLSKAKGKEGVLDLHKEAHYHNESQIKAKLFLDNYLNPDKRIDTQIDSENRRRSEENKQVLSSIVEVVLLCGRQGLPLRGHRDDSTADALTNRGNFLAILETMAKKDEILERHLQFGKKNQKYTSKTVQNEIISIASSMIRRNLLECLQQSKYYSVIADEVTDPHSNQEILSVCVRMVDFKNPETPEIKEVFLDFLYLQRTKGVSIAAGILKILEANNLDLKMLRGQAYDGAAAMSSGNVGTQAIIREKAPMALFTHCSSHVLNLVVAHSCSVQSLRNMVSTINELFLFYDKSPKRQRQLETVLAVFVPDNKKQKLKGLCKTRWVERHDCFDTLFELYQYVVTSLHAMVFPARYPDIPEPADESWDWDRKTRTDATGLHASLSAFEGIISLIVLKNGLYPVKGLSQKLQKRDKDIYDAYKDIDFVREEVRSLRCNIEETWKEWYEEAVQLADLVGSEATFPRVTKVQRHRPNTPAESAVVYYKRTIAIPFLDNFSGQLNERFSPEARKMKSITALVPAAMIQLSQEQLSDTIDGLAFWVEDLPNPDDLKREVASWQRYWKFKNNTTESLPDNLISALAFADAHYYPNIRELLVIGCASPIGSCEAERSFSALRRIKTSLRSTMSEERLSGLTLMQVHYTETLLLSCDRVVQEFVQKQPRQMFCQSIMFD